MRTRRRRESHAPPLQTPLQTPFETPPRRARLGVSQRTMAPRGGTSPPSPRAYPARLFSLVRLPRTLRPSRRPPPHLPRSSRGRVSPPSTRRTNEGSREDSRRPRGRVAGLRRRERKRRRASAAEPPSTTRRSRHPPSPTSISVSRPGRLPPTRPSRIRPPTSDESGRSRGRRCRVGTDARGRARRVARTPYAREAASTRSETYRYTYARRPRVRGRGRARGRRRTRGESPWMRRDRARRLPAFGDRRPGFARRGSSPTKVIVLD